MEKTVDSTSRWILVVTALSCALLEIVDMTVVNVALREMMGSLGATSMEIAWVVTSYAIGNVITVPLSGMLANTFGRKVYFTASVVIFTFASLMCGLSSSLWMLILWRFVQGLGGGGLLSTAQSIIADAFPPEQLPTATAVFGLGMLLGPAFGPVMGGYITDNWSWHWIFFINLPVGIIASVLSWNFIPDLEDARKPGKMDWPGIFFLVMGLCSLQFFLEEGSGHYWFESTEMTVVFIIAVTGLAAFIWRELTTDEPAVNIKLYRNANLAIGHFLNLMLGMMLVGIFFIFPLFTQVTLNWTATQQGAFLIPSAVFSAAAMVLVSKVILKKIGYHASAIGGILLFSGFLALLSFSSPDSSEKNFYWPFMLSALGRAMLMIPLMSMALAGLRGKDLAQATGLSNIMRSLGSAIGIALMNIYMDHEGASVRVAMLQNITPFNDQVSERLGAFSQRFLALGYSPDDAGTAATRLLSLSFERQQQLVTYNNAYLTVALIFLLFIFLILLIKTDKAIESSKS